MPTSPITAAAFYNAAKPATKAASVIEPTQNAFGDLASSFAKTLQAGEETSKQALAGKADMPTLIESLASSEVALEMAVTVRDKVVAAYQEILRMPV